MMHLLIYFSSMLLLGAILICGWYAITRGEWQIKPDNTWVWSGKIFSAWQRFWEETVDSKMVYYKDGQLIKFMIELEKIIPIKGKYDFVEDAYCIRFNLENFKAFEKNIHYAQHSYLDFQTVVKPDLGSVIVFFFQEESVYRFPEWVRSPLASCIFCHSSIYGSLIWWGAFLASNLFFHSFDLKLILLLWIPYMMSLSYVAPFLYKQI